MGDFNAILRADERAPSGRVSTCFADWVNEEGMIDLGFQGPRYSWNHGNDVQHRRSARLDRVLYEEELHRRFPSANITHCPHEYSDHCPLLLNMQAEERTRLGARPFRFQAA